MGKNNQQRRAAKRRVRAAAQRQRTDSTPNPRDAGEQEGTAESRQTGPASRPEGAAPPTDLRDESRSEGRAESRSESRAEPRPGSAGRRADAESEAFRLVTAGVQRVGRPAALDNAVRDLVVFSGTSHQADVSLAELCAQDLLVERVALAYTSGWQPADLMHVVRRVLGPRSARLAGDLVVEEALSFGAMGRAPDDWLAQLEAIADRTLVPRPPGSPPWRMFRSGALERIGVWDAWHDVLTLLAHWSAMYAMPKIGPSPSEWRHQRSAAAPGADRTTGHDPKKLATIRALLAKAEATEFSEEADAFTAKAQDLMTRYAIDEALLWDAAEQFEIRTRRVHVDNPYASTKAQLLATVASVNRAKAIWDDEHGIMTVVGLPVDIDLSEMLFTSLLVQATKAMTEAGSAERGGHRLDRSPSFRRAFLLAYAHRIGERLTEAGMHAQQEESEQRGQNLLPVLARQSAAVEAEFVRLFPHTTQGSSKRVDARGWQAGRAAADRAVFARGQVDGRSA